MRIASISPEQPRPGSAAEMHLRQIADGLEREGHHVTRLWCGPGTGPRLLQLVAFQLQTVRRLRDFDLLYCRWHPLGFVQYGAARVLRIPYVLEVNGNVDELALAYPRVARCLGLLRRTTSWAFRGAAHVVAVSPGLADWVRDETEHRVPVTWLPNGAPDELAALQRPPTQPPYAAFIGELATWQGLDTLLAARRSASWPSGVRLVVVGSGKEVDLVEEAAREGLLEYLGRLPRAAAQEVMARATVTISPQTARLARNRLGVTPLKVAESLMLGVPVIASCLRGQADIVQASPGGHVVTPDSPDELAGAVASAVTAVTDREQLTEYAKKSVSWRSTAQRTSTICRSVGPPL